MLTKVSLISSVSAVLWPCGDAQRAPGDILGRSLSNIVLKTAQACTVDRTPEGLQMPVTQHPFFSPEGFGIRMNSDIFACASVLRGSAGLSGTVSLDAQRLCVRWEERKEMQTHLDGV